MRKYLLCCTFFFSIYSLIRAESQVLDCSLIDSICNTWNSAHFALLKSQLIDSDSAQYSGTYTLNIRMANIISAEVSLHQYSSQFNKVKIVLLRSNSNDSILHTKFMDIYDYLKPCAKERKEEIFIYQDPLLIGKTAYLKKIKFSSIEIPNIVLSIIKTRDIDLPYQIILEIESPEISESIYREWE